jgi:alkaline phosphatase D
MSRIAFGSCAHQGQPQPIWDAVAAAQPDLFLLTGDNIYGDTRDMQVMRDKYAQFNAVPGFADLRRRIPLLGTWDDHDYGENNAGVEYPMKRQSQQALLDFFNVPADSPRRTREGVYHAESFGPPGRRVQVILLDTRYFRSPVKLAPEGKGTVPNNDPGVTILGDAQWRWLEAQFRHPADVRLIVSSIQVVAEGHGGEKWMNFPGERQRLYDLIRDTRANGVIFLSGDRHFADLSVMEAGVGYPLFDVTSSGLTQAARRWRPLSPNTNRVAGMSFDTNFGLIEIDWRVADPIVSLQIRDEAGDVRINQKFPLSLLRPAERTRGTTTTTAATAR